MSNAVHKNAVTLVNPPPLQRVEKHDRPEFPHIGLGYLAASLRRESISCSVIDAKLERLSIADVVERILSSPPLLLGITSMTHEIGRAEAVAKTVKDKAPSIPIAIGGVHAIALPGETLEEFPCFDFLFAGEAEHTLPALAREILAGGRDHSGIEAFACREHGAVALNPRRSFISDLDALPYPAWDLFPPARKYPLSTARGCPNRCAFCARPYGDRIRARSAENVADEIGLLVEKYKPDMMYVFDETFGHDRERFERLMDLMISRGYHKSLKWDAGFNLDVVTKEMLSRMKAAGCVSVMFGVESGDENIVRSMGKKIDLEKAMQAAQWIRGLGLRAESFFILGHPNETVHTAMNTIRFAARLNTTDVSIGIMAPYPGTALFRMAQRGRGGYRLISRDWRDFNKQLGKALELEKLPRYKLELLQLSGYVWFYLYNLRIAALARFAWNLRREACAFAINFFRGFNRAGA